MKVFVSFDERYDDDLYALFVEQSLESGSAFEVVCDGSNAMRTRGWSAHPRANIRNADEVVFLCGQHTHESLRVSLELEITREEDKPYMMVWGRREGMCTKPEGALPADGMYSWTREILESQMAAAIRAAAPRVIPESCKRVPGRGKASTKTPEGVSPPQSSARDDSPPDQRGR